MAVTDSGTYSGRSLRRGRGQYWPSQPDVPDDGPSTTQKCDAVLLHATRTSLALLVSILHKDIIQNESDHHHVERILLGAQLNNDW